MANSGATALTLNGSTLTCDISEIIGTSDRISIAGTLVLNGVNTLALALPAADIPPGSYTLMTYAALGGGGTFILDKAYSNAVVSVGATSVTVSFTDSNTVYWKGGA